jgi:hypothetical protein
LHIAALGVAVIGFTAAALGWVSSHSSTTAPGSADVTNFGGLLFGTGLGLFLLWRELRSTPVNTRMTISLYTGWIAVFAWYWFNRFAVSEHHSLDAGRIAHEHAQQTTISMGIFLVWVGLYLIGPILTARRFRH